MYYFPQKMTNKKKQKNLNLFKYLELSASLQEMQKKEKQVKSLLY